jgi:protein-disulfide isomerase
MTDPYHPRWLSTSIETAKTRRQALGLLGAGALVAGLAPVAAAAQSDDPPKDAPPADDDVLNEAAVLRDPDIPVAGNSSGNITIVEWFDYQCPYCRKLEPDLAQVVKADGKVRMVFKDWPILGPASVYTSGLVLATRYQDKFLQAHATLMSLDVKLTEAGARDRLAKAGIDVDRALADLETNKAAIGAVLKRNDDQATAFGFKGTPAFIVGKFRVPGVLTKEQFVAVIADARKAAKKGKT